MKRVYGVADWQNAKFNPPELADVFKVCLNGEEIPHVLVADTEAGVIKTFFIKGAGSFLSTLGQGSSKYYHDDPYPKGGDPLHKPSDYPGRDIEDGWLSYLVETLRGKVELFIP